MRKSEMSRMMHPLSKCIWGGLAAGTLALVPFVANAQTATTSTTTTVTTTTAAEPTLVSGTVVRYYVDRTGYVTAMDVQTPNGVQMVSFPANRAGSIYGMYPVGGNVDVWVTPVGTAGSQWYAVGTGTSRPGTWWRTFNVSDVDWLEAEPYYEAGAKETKFNGSLKGVVTNDLGEVLALIVRNDGENVLVRVPPQVRQIAPDHTGDERVAQLFSGASVAVVGTPEAPRRGGLVGGYHRTVAATSLRINGKSVGAIGIPARSLEENSTLLNWNVGRGLNDKMTEEERRAAAMGYTVYVPLSTTTTTTAGTGTTMAVPSGTTTTTTTTTTEMATGRVMVVGSDGALMPVVRQNGRLWVQGANGQLTQLRTVGGKYVVPESMTGARMMMVMSDGRRMEMDTVNGQLMVIMPDGSMAPVTLHTP